MVCQDLQLALFNTVEIAAVTNPHSATALVSDNPPCAIDRLPFEVLSRIMQFVAKSPSSIPNARHPLSPAAHSNVLRNISRGWRATADNTRSLWTDFVIFPTRPHPANTPSWSMPGPNSTNVDLVTAHRMMQGWIERAVWGSQPGHVQTIRFDFASRQPDRYTPAEKIIVQILVHYSPHWARAYLVVPYGGLIDLVGIRSRLDSLTYLCLCVQSPPPTIPPQNIPNANNRQMWSLFEVAPRLVEFEAHRIWNPSYNPATPDALQHIPPMLKLPWAQLENIVVKEKYAPWDIVGYLHYACNASSIHIRPGMFERQIAPGNIKLSLRRVSRITYSCPTDGPDWNSEKLNPRAMMLEPFVAKHLRTFRLVDRKGESSPPFVLAMIQRSQPKAFRDLVMFGPGSGHQWVMDCLDLMDGVARTLENLEMGWFEEIEVAVRMVEGLAERISDPRKFPRLRKLNVGLFCSTGPRKDLLEPLKKLCKAQLTRLGRTTKPLKMTLHYIPEEILPVLSGKVPN